MAHLPNQSTHEMSDIYEYTEEELRGLGDIIIWTTIYAAIHNDGVIQPTEKAVAIRQTHVRAISSEPYLVPIYRHLETHFEADFDRFAAELSGTQDEKEEYIQGKLEKATEILPIIGPLFPERFTRDLGKLYNRVFSADSSIFQLFMMPILTNRLDKFGRKE